MGCCCYRQPEGTPPQSICFNVNSPDDCAFTGLYSEGPCGGCNPLVSLSTHLSAATNGDPAAAMAVQPTYFVLFDFRDVILRRSALGREALALFETHERSMFDLLGRDERLRERWPALLAKGAVLAQDILRAYAFGGVAVAAGTLRLDRRLVEEITGFLREVAAAGGTEQLDDLRTRAGRIIESLAGRTGREILAALEVEGEQGTEGTEGTVAGR